MTWYKRKEPKTRKKGPESCLTTNKPGFLWTRTLEKRSPCFFSRILCKKNLHEHVCMQPHETLVKMGKLLYPPDIVKNICQLLLLPISMNTWMISFFLIDIIHMNIDIFNHITKYKMIYNKEITKSYMKKLAFLLLALFLTLVHV